MKKEVEFSWDDGTDDVLTVKYDPKDILERYIEYLINGRCAYNIPITISSPENNTGVRRKKNIVLSEKIDICLSNDDKIYTVNIKKKVKTITQNAEEIDPIGQNVKINEKYEKLFYCNVSKEKIKYSLN